MSDPVALQVRQGVALVTLDAPPVNALTASVCAALAGKVAAATADPAVAAIVLLARGRYFSAGGDIRTNGAGGPALTDLCARIETCGKPVIAALQGPALAGGAELVLAAHYRLALPDAAIGLPEITLGLIPGAGATQRLPRLTGAEAALNLMLGGRAMPAEAAQRAGLIDGVVRGDLRSGAFAFARALTERGEAPQPVSARRHRMADGIAWMDAITRRRAALAANPLRARVRVIDCVEAALLLPFAAGVAFEATAGAECMADPQSVALRHLFLAERRIAATLMARDPDGQRVLTDAAREIADQLRAALLRAATALEKLGHDRAAIDAALVAYGFAEGPFGGNLAGLGNKEIVARCIAALMAEGARLTEAGAVARASDIDVIAVRGAGFPRLAGGPMRAAQTAGLTHMMRQMRDWVNDDRVWAIPPLLAEAVKVADGFDALPPAL